MPRPRKATALRLIEGNPGHRPLPENEPRPTGKLTKPKWLKGQAGKIWGETAPQLYWLTESDSYKLGVWCGLYAEIIGGLAQVNSARITQWRVLGSELGLDPASRARMVVPDDGNTDPADKFFT